MTTANERRQTPRRQIALSKQDWDELGDLVGKNNRSDVIRQMVRALLGRPGVKMPKRGDFPEPPHPASGH